MRQDLTDVKALFTDTDRYVGTEIKVAGWVRSNRNSKNVGFLVVNDGTYFTPLQVVYSAETKDFEKLGSINVGAAVIAKGKLVATPDAKQPFELQAEEVAVEGESTPDYPLQKKRHTM